MVEEEANPPRDMKAKGLMAGAEDGKIRVVPGPHGA
jgi:hypothetical protein